MLPYELEKYDLYSADFKAKAYQTYAQMRDEGAIRLHQGMQRPIWFVTGYDEAKAILSDHKRFVSDYRRLLSAEQQAELAAQPTADLFSGMMLNADRPDHTRLRTLVSQAFTTRRIQKLGPRIQQISDELLDAVQQDGQMDLLDAYAFPLPIIVICELLGVPAIDRDKFRLWSNSIIEINENSAVAMQHIMAFMRYIGEMLADRRQNPQDDLITALVHAEDAGEQLSESELYSMVVLLIVAGHETTVNLIGNSILALLQHPEQLAQLQQDPALIDGAIEEFLRYDGAVERTTTRFAIEDVEIGGQRIERGTPVIVVVGAANRDPQQFANADQLDISRSSNKHLDFGYGIHYCMGAPLARLEGKIAINTLIQRIPDLRLAVPVDQLVYRTSTIVRGLVKMPVVWSASD